MQRVGFLQTRILPLFGFYPWRCPECKTRFLLRSRGAKRKKVTSATSRRGPETDASIAMTDKDSQLV
jgi:hypothetical protein